MECFERKVVVHDALSDGAPPVLPSLGLAIVKPDFMGDLSRATLISLTIFDTIMAATFKTIVE